MEEGIAVGETYFVEAFCYGDRFFEKLFQLISNRLLVFGVFYGYMESLFIAF